MSNEDKGFSWSDHTPVEDNKIIPDLPERPLPKPIPKEGTQKWTPEIPAEIRNKPVGEETSKKLALTVSSILFPLIGLTIIIGGIFFLVSALLSFYATS